MDVVDAAIPDSAVQFYIGGEFVETATQTEPFGESECRAYAQRQLAVCISDVSTASGNITADDNGAHAASMEEEVVAFTSPPLPPL